jgi:hypothetical protein
MSFANETASFALACLFITLACHLSAAEDCRTIAAPPPGIGAADDSDGKSLNADVAITTGTIRNTTWNRFASLRLAGAHGYPGNVCCFGGATGTNLPPDNYLLIAGIGATARVGEVARFVYEAGFGRVLTRFTDRHETGRVFYLSIGVVFHTHEHDDPGRTSSRSAQ